MPKEYLKCKSSLISQGKSEKDAARICAIRYYKKHGKSVKDAAKENSLSEDNFADEFELDRDRTEEEVFLHLDYLSLCGDDKELQAKWKAPTARKEVPDSHFLWVKKTKTGKGKVKKFPYKDSKGDINCTAVATAIRALRGARTGKNLTKKYPGVLEKAQGIWNSHCAKNNNKKQSEDILTMKLDNKDRFMTFVELGEAPVAIKSKPITIEILRTGKFKHPWFGELNITKTKLSSMVKNFNKNVLGRDISFDFSHRSEGGASGWVEKLFLADEKGDDGKMTKCTLSAIVHPTVDGVEAIKNQKYRYFSSEYTDNYRDKETGEEHGPTLVGGGFTNRPFIPYLKPMALSEDLIERLKNQDEEVDIAEYIFSEEEDVSADSASSQELNSDNSNEEITDTGDGDSDGDASDNDQQNLSDGDQTSNDDIDDKNKNLEDDMGDKNSQTVSGDASQTTNADGIQSENGGGKQAHTGDVVVNLEDLKAKVDNLEGSNQQLLSDKAELGKITTDLVETNTKLSEKLVTLEAKLGVIENEKFEMAKDKFLSDLSGMRLPPAMTTVVGKFISMENEAIAFKCSDGKEYSITKMLKEIFISMPSDLIVPAEEEEADTSLTDAEKAQGFDVDAIRDRLKKLNVPLTGEDVTT